MNWKPLPGRCPLEQLPAEIQQMILSALPDFQSLQAAILCSSTIYAAFASANASVTSRVLLNQVDFDVMPEAFTALQSLHLFKAGQRRTREETREVHDQFAAEYLNQRRQSTGLLLLHDAMRIVKLHECIHAWAATFADATLKTMREETMYERSEPDPDPYDSVQVDATDNEMKRIKRAFYLVEIYCNLYRPALMRRRSHLSLYLEDVRRVFFSNFAPWENEQLACVMEFVVQMMSQGRKTSISLL